MQVKKWISWRDLLHIIDFYAWINNTNIFCKRTKLWKRGHLRNLSPFSYEIELHSMTLEIMENLWFCRLMVFKKCFCLKNIDHCFITEFCLHINLNVSTNMFFFNLSPPFLTNTFRVLEFSSPTKNTNTVYFFVRVVCRPPPVSLEFSDSLARTRHRPVPAYNRKL